MAAGELRVATGEVRVLRTERDLLKEQLNKFKRPLFAAKSEASGLQQKDLFFNEAEHEGEQSEPAAEEDDSADTVEVPGHRRRKRGCKPLDPALPREVVRHALPEHGRVCPHDGSVLKEVGVEASEQLDSIPQQVRVIRHERVKYACPCCDELLLANPHAVLPGSLLGKALHDMSSQWSKLNRFVEVGAYPIDNNVCENAIRPFCVGRRNWLFADTVAGANASTSANLYSLLRTCIANGIDGYRYLRALMVALPTAKTIEDHEARLPWRIDMDGD